MEKEVKHDAREYLEYLGFKKTNNGWKDGFDLFIFDSNVPTELCDLVKIMNGTAFRKGEDKANLKNIK